MSTSVAERYHWTRETYGHAVEAGVFGSADVQLRHGEVVSRVSPRGPRHAWAVQVLNVAFVDGLDRSRFAVRSQDPIARTDDDEPEPDLAVVTARRYAEDHPGPGDIHLLIEVSDSSYRDDQRKLREYAEVAVPQVWLVDVARRQVEVHTSPDPAARGYRDVAVHPDGDLTFDGVRLAVTDLF